VSLDGKIAGPGGDFSMFPTQGDHIEMLFRDYPDTLPGPALSALGIEAPRNKFSTVLMGWNTYAAGLPHGVDDPYPHLQQVVFSRQRQPDEVPQHVSLVTSDPVGEVRRLKEGPGSGIWLCGGGQLASALADEIDELVLKVNPLVIGAGIPLFAGAVPGRLELTESSAFVSGVVVNTYRRRPTG